MFHSLSNHARGLIIAATGGMVLTIDIPLIRLAGGDSWSILFLRAGSALVAALAAWLIWKMRSGRAAPPLMPGRAGIVVAFLYGLSTVSFIIAVHTTSTANLVFILVFNTAFAMLLSWLILRERPRPATLAALVLMVTGVMVIVNASIGSGYLVGDMAALSSAFLLALAITISRADGRDMGFAALVGNVLPLVVATWFVARNGLNVEAPIWVIIDGAVVMPLSFFLLATAPRFIGAPEVAMFYLLETVLAPIWVWAIFAEVPSRASLVGGLILILTLIGHSVWQLRSARRRSTRATA